jgi:trans-aconitate methyltransferase
MGNGKMMTKEQMYKCPRITIPDGQKKKDISFELYSDILYGNSKKASKFTKNTGMSERLCTIFDLIYKKHMQADKPYLFFDCGCSDARLVKYVQDHYTNIIPSGCEITPHWIEYAAEMGCDVFYGDINHPESFGERRYDVILSSKVLNLTKDFRQSLLNLCSMLYSNGIIILLFGFTTNTNASHYCLIEHPDIVSNWIENYKEFDNMKVLEIVYNNGDFEMLLAPDEVLMILHKTSQT